MKFLKSQSCFDIVTMLLPHVSSTKPRNVNVSPYRVSWDKACKSKFQFNVKQFLRGYWEGDDCYEELPVVGTLLTCDFVNFSKMIAVEADGKFHKTYVPFYHKNRMGFLKSLKRDQQKDAWLRTIGFKIIRISEEEINKLNLEWLMEKFAVDIREKFE